MKVSDLFHNGHHWTATVFAPDPPDGRTEQVDDRWGSWQVVTHDETGEHRRFCLPPVAAELQRLVKREERRAARTA